MEDNVKIYVAFKHSSAPILPLRGELDIVAIECIYEPEQKSRQKKKKGKRKRIWPFKREREFSEIDSSVGSTTSSVTMTVSPKIETNDFEDIPHYSFVDDDLPSIMFSGNDDDSSCEIIDDMTINTAALVGTKNVSIRPEFIFTHADNDNSTTWWYERSNINIRDEPPMEALNTQNYGSENEYEYNLSHNNCFDGMSFLIDNSPMACCTIINSVNISEDNHELKLDIDYNKEIV